MANRFWNPPADANWGDANVWATTDGGDTTGVATPTSSDDVFFSNTNTHKCTIGAEANCYNLDCTYGTGFSGIITGGSKLNVYGNFTLSTSITWTLQGTITFKATSPVIITMAGKTIGINGYCYFDGVGGTFTLNGNLSDYNGGRGIYLVNGYLKCVTYALDFGWISIGSGTRISFGTNTHIFRSYGANVFVCSPTATIDSGSYTLKLTNKYNQNSTFAGGGKTYNNFYYSPGTQTGSMTITGSNTFNNFKDDGTAAHSIKFTDGTTQTISSLTVNGSSGKLITLTGTSISGWNISDSSGTNEVTYCNISYSNAIGGATFNALTDNGCVDGDNNTGWNFSISSPTVTTQAATNIATTSFTGNGNITATGGANATRRGFCYKVGTSGDPTTSDSTAYDDGSFGTGAFTKSITGLTAVTDYRVRAYAVNSAGTSYGSTVDVKTLSVFKPRITWFN